MARYKQKLRTTRSTEWYLRFMERVIAKVGGIPTQWDDRQLATTDQQRHDFEPDLDRVTSTARFSASVPAANHYRVVARFSDTVAYSHEAEAQQISVYPTRVWVEHRIGSWQTHWYMLECEDGELKIVRHRMESHE